ncbi:MAG: retropepsin-like domain-containing protein [Treponema sp.]|nr:retropepsin-like domain-containing protein [Treponema sp.]
MGDVRENITFKNAEDTILFNRGDLKEAEIRQATVPVLVDTGCHTVVLTEATARRLGVVMRDRQMVTLAGGVKHEGIKAGAVEIHWKDRYTICFPVVLPGEKEDLMGVIPLEDMDLLVDPVRQRLAGAHGDVWAKFIK